MEHALITALVRKRWWHLWTHPAGPSTWLEQVCWR